MVVCNSSLAMDRNSESVEGSSISCWSSGKDCLSVSDYTSALAAVDEHCRPTPSRSRQ